MRTAVIHVQVNYWFLVEIFDDGDAKGSIPMLEYRFIVAREEMRCLPELFIELGVRDHNVTCLAPQFYRKEMMAIAAVFNPTMPPDRLVQQSFW